MRSEFTEHLPTHSTTPLALRRVQPPGGPFEIVPIKEMDEKEPFEVLLGKNFLNYLKL